MKEQSTLAYLYEYIEEQLRNQGGSKSLKLIEASVIEKDKQDKKRLAIEGCKEARQFLINTIYFLLVEKSSLVNTRTVDSYIRQYHIDYYKNIFLGQESESLTSLSSLNSDHKLEVSPIDLKLAQHLDKYSISEGDDFDKKLFKLSQIIYQEIYGYSILDELIFDNELNEVACTRHDYIWLQYKGIKKHISNPSFRFSSVECYRKVIENRLTSTAREEMNAGAPLIYAMLLNGARVTALRPPLSRHYVVNIRLFAHKTELQKYRDSFVEKRIARIIELLAGKGRRNVAIIGEQGSGKTTAADQLIISNLDKNISIGLAENIHELNISGNYPEKNIVELQYSNNYKPSDITEIFFRLNRDIIIYGEVRSCNEAFEMIKAMLRQARGSLFTFHTSSVSRMIHDLRQLLMQTGNYTDFREAQFDVADAIDLVIQIKLDRQTGHRYVYKLSEVIAHEQDMSFEVNDLFRFNKEKECYETVQKGISKSQLTSCMEYEITQYDVQLLENLWMDQEVGVH